MTKTLDAKLAALHAEPGVADAFILADAKDADMAYGLAATGIDPVTGVPRSLADYRDQVREIVAQGLVDVMLMSVSTSELLTAVTRNQFLNHDFFRADLNGRPPEEFP